MTFIWVKVDYSIYYHSLSYVTIFFVHFAHYLSCSSLVNFISLVKSLNIWICKFSNSPPLHWCFVFNMYVHCFWNMQTQNKTYCVCVYMCVLSKGKVSVLKIAKVVVSKVLWGFSVEIYFFKKNLTLTLEKSAGNNIVSLTYSAVNFRNACIVSCFM